MNGMQRLEKLKLRQEQERFYMDQLRTLLENPLVEFALGTMFIGYVTRGRQSLLERLTGADVMAGAMGTGLVGIISAQQLSKAVPYLAQLTQAAPVIGGLLK